MGPEPSSSRPVALVTGASRRQGIAAAIARELARDGWDVATTFWQAYDARVHGSDAADVAWLREQIESQGAKSVALEADLSEIGSAGFVFDAVERGLGPVTCLVLAHCEGVDSDLLGTTVESFDRHFAVNARGSWQLVREMGRRYRGLPGRGRIVALTSDHFVGNGYRLDDRGPKGGLQPPHSAESPGPARRLRQRRALSLFGGGRLDQRPAPPQQRRPL